MFRHNQNDWLGEPLQSWDERFETMGNPEYLRLQNQNSLIWCEFNTRHFPLNHPKIRKALAYAINREALLKTIKYPGMPATTPLPLAHTQHLHHSFKDGDIPLAKELLSQALKELNIHLADLPPFVIQYGGVEIRKKIAFCIADQLTQHLGLRVICESYSWKELFSKLLNRNFQIALVGWNTWFDDPLNTLNIFSNSRDAMNSFGWRNEEFNYFVKKAKKTQTIKKRKALYIAAEKILLNEMPMIPLFYEQSRYLAKPWLQGIIGASKNRIDFTRVLIKKQ